MSDPLAGAPYGLANWTDFTHNWRKADGDFLQKRSILRYATTATRNAISSPEAGMTIYNAETDRLEFRKADGTWSGLYVTDGLLIAPVVGSPPDIKLSNPAAGTNGLVFTATQIVTQVPITTAGGEVKMDATGLTVSTGTLDAKLTTDTTSLKSDVPFVATSLSSTGTLNVTGATTLSGAVIASTTISALNYVTAPRLLIGAASPAAANDATRKDYVEGMVSARVAKTGDTMSSSLMIHQEYSSAGGHTLRLRDVSNKPFMDWMDWAGTQLGWIQGTSANLNIWAKGDILLNSGGGQVRTSDAIYTTGGVNRFFTQSNFFIGSGNTAYLAYYPNGSNVDTPGQRSGYIGFAGNAYMYMVNENNGSSNFYNTDHAHIWSLSPNGSTTAQTEMARIMFNVGFMVKPGGNYTHTINGHTLWHNGLYYSTTTEGDAATNFYVNRLGSVHGSRWMWFGKDSVWLASIYQNGTSGAVYATTSDYRIKTIVSPITDATDRLMALKPWRVTWNGDPERGETDDFLAHEVQDIVPDAVLGEKDAVDEEGNEVHQHMAEYRLMALTVASLQDTIRRVDALERNLGQLSAA